MVAPEVSEPLARERVPPLVVVLLEFRHRHQLDGRDAEVEEVRDLLDEPAERPRVLSLIHI